MKNSLIISVLAASLLGSSAYAGDTYFGVSYSALDLDTEFLGRTSTADLDSIHLEYQKILLTVTLATTLLAQPFLRLN